MINQDDYEASYTGDQLLYNEKTETDIDFFEENLQPSYNGIPEFLEFHSSISESTKQGILGLLTDKTGENKYVYKMSQQLNYLINQEFLVLYGLNKVREYCPHFCKTMGKFKTTVPCSFKSSDNPFEQDDDAKTIDTDVLLMEYVEGRKLYRYLKNENVTPEILMSLIKQTLIATMIASDAMKFVHYDLHSNNVIVKQCPTNSVFLYVLDENRTYLVPTYGYYPVIIDYGFAFNENCEDQPMYCATAHTEIGFLSTTCDKNADAKLFLTSVSHEMKTYKNCKESRVFRQLVKNIYKNCRIDMECGWDDVDGISVSDQLLKKMSSQFKRSKFLKNHGHHVVDILQSLVYLPMTKRTSEDSIEDLVSCIVTEFIKIEREIGEDFYNMYIFKNIVESARNHRLEYTDKNSRSDAILYFKEDVLGVIDSIVKFCNPKINWEKLLCSLLCLSKCIENFCLDRMQKLLSRKKVDYNKMALKNTTEILESIEANIPSHFYFDKNTSIYVWDCIKQRGYKTKINDQLTNQINETHPYERGVILYEYLSSKDF